MRTRYQNLRIYVLAEDLSDRIWLIVGRWKPFERNTVGIQIVRAADSIGANIAEGAGRSSNGDNRRFLRIARGSLNETQHWLRRAFRRNLLSEQDIGDLKCLLDELAPKLNAYLRSIGKASPPPDLSSSE
jgi:four helix bundle protein